MYKIQEKRCDILKKFKIEILAGAMLFLTAAVITLYPLISSRYNEAHQSQIQQEYQQVVEQQDNTEKEKVLELARQYNAALQPGVWDSDSQNLLLWASEDYADQLDITGTGIMGYIQIPSIGVNFGVHFKLAYAAFLSQTKSGMITLYAGKCSAAAATMHCHGLHNIRSSIVGTPR